MKEKNRILNKFDQDKTRPVLFSESFGGSESQVRLLFKYVPDKNFENINLILNNTEPSLVEKIKLMFCGFIILSIKKRFKIYLIRLI